MAILDSALPHGAPPRRPHRHRRGVAVLTALIALSLGAASPVLALRKASHKGWPTISGVLLINKFDQARPLDARPGHDPFDGADPSYRCDGDHHYQGCFVQAGACLAAPLAHRPACSARPLMPLTRVLHNELLGGHGNDTIYGGDGGDVIWGDYKPSGQPSTQTDHIFAGRGNDFIYTSHGTNIIHTGGGVDVVHAHFGRGEIFCDSPTTLVYLSHRSSHLYTLHGCGRITFKAAGTQPA